MSTPTARSPKMFHQMKADPDARLSPAATIIGSVTIEAEACVLAGAHIRADYYVPVVIERGANVQEGVLIHVDEGFPVTVGARATIGHGAILHGCTVEPNALVGMGATVLNGAIVETGAVVGAGAVVPQGMVVPAGHLALGVPARVVRALSQEEIDTLCSDGADFYIQTSATMVEAGVLLNPSPDDDIWMR